MSPLPLLRALGVSVCAVIGCAQQVPAERTRIELPPGFAATVFADELGPVRHLAVRENGDVYAALRARGEKSPGGLAALRDSDADGRADRIERFGPPDVDTGLALFDGGLYFSSTTAVYKIPLEPNRLVPSGMPERVAGGFPAQRSHSAKSITFDREGNLYVNSGAPSNSCQEQRRSRGSPGLKPCPQLERSGGIWRFAAGSSSQDQREDGVRFSTGSRQIVALEYDLGADRLYMVMHGRDQLDQLWPDSYTAEERIELPAEEFHAVAEGDDFGWPYTYYDPLRDERMVAPEYGGDGETPSPPGLYKDPLIAFPAHWAPNDLIFYTGETFPKSYRGGAFIAFHGSWNRQPALQAGYNVVFVPMRDGRPAGDWRVFASGFEGPEPVAVPAEATHRPAGLAEGPDGSLYIADDARGRIWKVSYTGD